MINANGYHHTRTDEGWEPTHRLIAEQVLERKLLPTEMVRFKDGDRKNLTLENIEVIKTGSATLRAKKARLEAQIEELTAQLSLINQSLGL
jgi:hypothetical protein